MRACGPSRQVRPGADHAWSEGRATGNNFAVDPAASDREKGVPRLIRLQLVSTAAGLGQVYPDDGVRRRTKMGWDRARAGGSVEEAEGERCPTREARFARDARPEPPGADLPPGHVVDGDDAKG